MDVTKEDLLAECARLRSVIRILTEGAGRQGLLLDFDVRDPKMFRIVVCAPERDERALLRAAVTELVAQLRSAGAHEAALAAMGDFIETAAAKNPPETIGSLAENP